MSGYLTAAFGQKLAHQVDWAAAGAGAVLVIAAGGLWRHVRLSKVREDTTGERTSGA